MSEETPSPASVADLTPSNTPINRRQIGLNVFLQILLGIALFAMVNYVGIRHFTQWDKTYDREFTLSKDTIAFLTQLDKKLAVTVIAYKGSQEHKDTWQLLEGYHREGQGKIKIDVVDPAKDKEAFDKLADEAAKLRMKLQDIDLGLFIRVIKGSAEPAEAKPTEAAPAASFIPMDALFVYTKDANQHPLVSGFNGEAALTGGLMSIARGDQPKLYVVTKKSVVRMVPGLGNAFGEINKMCARQNIKMLGLNLAQTDRIPEDASAVLLIGFELDLDTLELAMLREYWRGKHHAVFVMLNRSGEFSVPLLESFLAENGVVPQHDRVLRTYGTATGNEKLWQNSVTVLDGSPITNAQKGTVTNIPGRSSSLKLTPDAEIPRTENIEIKPLLSPTSGFWGEMNYDDAAPQAGPEDNAPPLYTAASLERGASKDAQISMDSSRMVVIGNSTMLEPDAILPQNLDLIQSSLTWLLQRDQYIGINPTPRSTYSLKITPDQKNRIFLITTIVLPALVLLLGVFVWGGRRS